MRIVAAILSLFLAGAAAAQSIEVTNSATGEIFTYQPSFSSQPAAAPTRQFYGTGRPSEYAAASRARQHMVETAVQTQRRVVRFATRQPAGTIIIDTRTRALYYVLGNGTAIRYGVGVGRDGFDWSGVQRVSAKKEWPDWRPPAEMRAREPWLPEFMPGGPGNPLGAAALYLGSTLYRIHGTSERDTIGSAVSSGCIRMLNEDILDLYARARVGARVIVLGPQSDRSALIAALR
ncbi:MAG: L,D-transpeptidase [Acuticoccus sp.]